jgi:hypothetical protein
MGTPMTDPLPEIKAELARVDSEGFSLSYRAARAYIDTLIGEVERLRDEVFELKIYRGFGQDHGHQRCVEEIARLRGLLAEIGEGLTDQLPEIEHRMKDGVWYDDSCYDALEWLVSEVKRLRAEVTDLKIALATASPGAYFSRYGERPALSELRRAASPAGDAPTAGS